MRPIFKAHCFHCHGEGDVLKGGLDLRLQRLIVKGGESGPGLVAGSRDSSVLFGKIRDGEMPPKDKPKLSAGEVELIGRWIDVGAPVARTEPEAPGIEFITEEERAFWAFQPVRRPAVPKVEPGQPARTPIDAFLLSELRKAGLNYSAEADKSTLIRRATFDLTGLPPTPEELGQFLADESPDAYEKLIDRLLSSQRYGERWGRHWLDVAGYADSDGYTDSDTERKYAYKYRDYVIRSFNSDKPLDQFIQEQLAGDEMVAPPYKNLGPEEIEKLVATGFLRMAPDGTGSAGVDQGQARNQVVADTIQVVSGALLGMTVACAQCHDHRYDPIPQADYYRMRAIFEPAYDPKNWRSPQARLISLRTEADIEKARAVEAEAAEVDRERERKQKEFIDRTFEKELAKLPEELRESIREARGAPVAKQTAEQKRLLNNHPSVNVSAGSLYLYDKKAADELKADADRAAAIRARKPPEDFIQALTEVAGTVPVTRLFHRGDPDQPKQPLPPGDLTVLAGFRPTGLPDNDPQLPTTGRRLAYARLLTDGTHPLTARVLVNRAWMHHFGRGIVATPGDFGQLGERPTQPELLDWLAAELVDGGWRLKRIHKLIMTSAAYRQSSRRTAAGASIDPDDRLYWRMPLRRLEAETIRDSILAVTGQLNLEMHGPPVPIREDDVGQIIVGIENKDPERKPGAELPMHGQEFRRSVYVQARRSRPLGFLQAFDAPSMDPNCERRSFSTVTPQSLLLMNSQFMAAQARAFAARLQREAGDDVRAQVRLAWRLAFSTEPAAGEMESALRFLAGEPPRHAAVAQQSAGTGGVLTAGGEPSPGSAASALSVFCHALLSSNGFLYVD